MSGAGDAEAARRERLARIAALRAEAVAADAAVRRQAVRGPKVVQVNARVMVVESREGVRRQLTTLPLNVRESWLRLAWWRQWITQRQFDAGMQLRDLHERSSLHSLSALDVGKVRVDGGETVVQPGPAQIEAARRYAEAVAALDTADFPCGRIVAAVAIEDLSASRLERRYRWRHGAGLTHIRTALDMLAEWWWGKEQRRGR